MTDFNTRELEASALRKAGDYQKALSIYRDLWKEQEGQFNNWATWSYAKCAQKCDQHDESDRIARACVDRWPAFAQGRQLLAWCNYYRHFQQEQPKGQPVPKTYWDAAEEVVDLCAADRYSKYTPFTRVVFAVVKHLEKSKATGSVIQKRFTWLGHLDHNRLSGDAGTYTDSEGKRRAQASDQENWYSHMSKALLDAKRYEECIALCEEAFGRIQSFHYDNEIWFSKRVAEAKSGLGRSEEALADFRQLVIKKPEWHLHYQVAVNANKLGQRDLAFRHSVEAALAPNPLSFKTTLFLLLAVLLRGQGKDDLAKKHAQLSASAYTEEGWVPKGRMLQLFQEFAVEINGGPNSKNLAKDLEKHWKTWATEALPRHEGGIDWVHAEKPFGFIKADGVDGSVFFQVRSFIGTKDRLVSGTRVSFFLKESYDAKKEQASTEAVKVTPIS